MQWISDLATNQSELSTGKAPVIYYDRKLLYHPTDPAGCRYKCVFNHDKERLGKGDVVVYSGTFSPEEARKLKQRGVLIVFESGESPWHMPSLDTSQLSQIDMFNTYMAASPVPYMYPHFVRNTKPKLKFTDEEKAAMLAKDNTYLLPHYHRQKTKIIAWVVSNHSPRNNRNAYAKAIAKFIQVDIYGQGGRQFPSGRDEFQWLSENYKFYLAFENSNCRNYITEKVTSNALNLNMVPIVLGAYKEDYNDALPPHSYINVDDFKSIRNLTDYLLYLDRNDTAYAEYFAWKEHGQIHSELSTGKAPVIYYDRKLLYHPTDPAGCRYKCVFNHDKERLGKGDVVVYSGTFSPEEARKLKQRGVLIVFESGESPWHMPSLDTSQLSQIDMFNTYMAASPIPYMYPHFVRNTKPKLKFTNDEKAAMLTRNKTYLLPYYHRQRTKLITWVVSNHRPQNNRNEYAKAIAKFIPIAVTLGPNASRDVQQMVL
ncbi:unnamed protein product [Mesocestoides corti]|uniref:Fucosyltransferase n=1 Tax=Mesocestoides corti TaxID=53468 RepID=A0A0R3ULC7_MESCO|nr:unnamed protein product [Mesocestoides corti]